jgi:hypothetical protein
MRKKPITFREWLGNLRQRAVESLPIRIFLYKFIKKFHNAWGRKHVKQVLRYFEMFALGIVAAVLGEEVRRFLKNR